MPPHTPPGNGSNSLPGPHEGIDETHDPNLRSWVESANDPNTDFPIQNLPLCLACKQDSSYLQSCVVIGSHVLSLTECLLAAEKAGFSPEFVAADIPDPFETPRRVVDLTSAQRKVVRRAVSAVLRSDSAWSEQLAGSLIEAQNALILPLASSSDLGMGAQLIRDYTDFYASIHHATNVGSMFRPDNALLPNYKHIPIGYHGRASSIVPSGTSFHRPVGQTSPPDSDPSAGPGFGPCKLMDYELEMGCIIGRGNALGSPISIAEAESHIFGLCIVNDWSARDMQKWEYVPLGPFLAKNFATTISPYIVTLEALAPFRIPAYERPASDPRPLPYLTGDSNTAFGGFDITLEVHLQSAEMARRSMPPVRLSKGSFKHMYWTFAQMLAHHASNGCNLQPGDLLASGTISGPTRDSRGSMIELTWDGDPFATPPRLVPGSQRTPIELPTGEKRTFLGDGDTVIMKAYCEREGFRRIGFGECRGTILPAKV